MQDECVNLTDSSFCNLSNIPWKTEDDIVKCVGNRFLNGEYYTWAGLALVAVNPCQEIPNLYSEDVKKKFNKYGEDRRNTALQPHLFAVAARVRHRLVYEVGKVNQAIVISGDSGSGKTFSARHLLNFLTTYGLHSSHYDVASASKRLWQIWCSAPLLTAFGNAQTECNNNSSRFGKLLQLQYNNRSIVGASIEIYLLEKTRVASHRMKERNFHIFHQLLAGMSSVELEALHLGHNKQFKIVPGPVTPEDYERYRETMVAMLELGINCERKQNVLVLLAAIMHLGNITFMSKGDTYDVNHLEKASVESLSSASDLLGLEGSCLTQLLTSKQIVAQSSNRRRPSVYHKPAVNVEECNSRRDCLMRFLYERLFHWIVSIINSKIKSDNHTFKELAILDIYGFEVFENNSLEQLCINYANERLQHFFVQDVLMEQQQILQEEGIETKVTSYSENEERLKLLDAPVSVFGILNEECTLQRYTNDEVLCQRLVSNLNDSKHLLPSSSFTTSQFIIRHYAGKVRYNVSKMLDKNMDKIPREMIELLGLSNSYFIRTILQQWDRFNNKPTLLSKFKISLDNLIKILKKTDVHYIRCVKATPHLAPGVVFTSFLNQQLQASGILEAISLTQQRFPIMLKYTEFMHRYGKLMKDSIKASLKNECKNYNTQLQGVSSTTTNESNLSCEIMKDLICTQNLTSHVMLGRHTLFLTESALLQLEDYRHQQRVEAAELIQKKWRKYLAHKTDAVIIIQQYFRKWQRKKMSKNYDSLMSVMRVNSESQCVNEFSEIESMMYSFKFIRSIHFGDDIVSRQALAKIPIRFHTRLTCLPFSHVLPSSERPKGLEDAIF